MSAAGDCHRRDEMVVLGGISFGLISICLAVVLGLFIDNNGLPNWAENVLVAISTAAALKLGDCISALVQLASGRTIEKQGAQLATSSPTPEAPQTAKEAAADVADAAATRAEEIEGG